MKLQFCIKEAKIRKLINIFSLLAMIINMSFIGVFFIAQPKVQAQVSIERNPVLLNTCGINVVLIMDSSSSMYGVPLDREKKAFKDFVDAFLPDTPTQMAVVDFNTNADVVQGFTNNVSDLKDAIDSSTTTPNPVNPGDEPAKMTNWQDALAKAYSLYPGPNNKPYLYVFASDGKPNRPQDITPPISLDNPMDMAIGQANIIKQNGIRIISLGIGNTLEDNLKQISGPIEGVDKNADVIMTDFDELANDLSSLAADLCGGSVIVKKYLDDVLADDWTFYASTTNGVLNQESGQTADGGYVVFEVNELDSQTAYVTISEDSPSGFNLVNAHCEGDMGTLSGNEISNIPVTANDKVNCKFYNETVSVTTGSIQGCKWLDEDHDKNWDRDETNMLSGWEIRLTEASTTDVIAATTTLAVAGNVGVGCYKFTDVPFGNYYISEVQQAGWTQTQPGVTSTPIAYQYEVLLDLNKTEWTGMDFGNYEITCGDNYVDGDEQCDDGNTEDGDGCSANCTVELANTGEVRVCKWNDEDGDGEFDPLLAPDFVASIFNPESSCVPIVGRAHPLSGWTMYIDNGNDYQASSTTDESGCVTFNVPYGDYTITEEDRSGWKQVKPVENSGFELNVSNESSCQAFDFLNYNLCGNGQLDGDEQCDDGNIVNGDGCSATCHYENLIEGCVYNNLEDDVCYNYDDPEAVKLGGFKVVLEQFNNDEYSEYATALTGNEPDMDNFGCFQFYVPDGQYRLGQDLTTGWTQTKPIFGDYLINANNGNVIDQDESECQQDVSRASGIMSFFIKTAHAQATSLFNFANHYKGSSSGPVCGNGIVETGEGCDDGNLENGDGCTAKCESEGGGSTYFTYTNQGSGATTPSTPTVKGEEGAPNLTIKKAVAQTEANAGDKNISYKIVVANNGNLTAFGVVVKDALPEGMTYVSDGSTSKTWEIGDLAPGESKDILYLTNIGEDVEPGVLTNTATANASNFGEVSDSAEVQVKEIKVLAETGFSLSELIVLLAFLSASAGSALYLKKKYLKA